MLLSNIRLKSFLKLLIINLLVFFFLVILIELIFRIFLISSNDINNWGYNLKGYGDLLPSKNFIASENNKLPYQVVTNSYGLRNEKETSLKKSKLRILAVGDSFTFGPYVNNFQTYPSQLERVLNRDGLNAEVLDAGISGYTLEDEIAYIKEKGIKLDPDLIIIGVFQNDVSDYDPSQRSVFARESQKNKLIKYGFLYQIAKQSAFLTFFQKSFSKEVTIRDQNKRTVKDFKPSYLEKYKTDLDKLSNYDKSKIIFVLFPAFNQINSDNYSPQQEISNLLERNYQVLDIKPVIEKESNPEIAYLIPENSHFSVYGYYLVSKQLSKIIEEKFKQRL